MAELYKIPLVLSPQPEGGYTVTSPVVPELVTEGDTVEAALEHVRDALKAVLEIYEETGKPVPANLQQHAAADAIWFEHLVSAA